MIKLSVNETKWSSLLARTHPFILYISISIFDFGPENLPGLSRNAPPGFGIRKTARGIRNSINDWNPEFKVPLTNTGIQYLESGIHGVESIIQDCLGFQQLFLEPEWPIPGYELISHKEEARMGY